MKTVATAKKIEASAKGYKTQAACQAAITRITKLWAQEGSYGMYRDAVQEAVWECQIRWQEIAGEKRDVLAAG
jgi:hypothetical protein